ncbi:MAG: toll/interleukin-1 receptor domain-containing protein [Tepidisphaeraceae bacterium]
MRESTFPKPIGEVVATLVELFRHQDRREIVDLLESAHAYFDETNFDNWNGGTYTWALRLEVPVHIFASIEPHLSSIEKEVGAKLSHFDRQYPNDHLDEVTISPIAPGASPHGQRIAPSELEVRRLWSAGRFRLFVSHVSSHKVMATSLKDALWLCGVHAFVAHEDIEPSLEWQDEIELGLQSMHALAALLTPDFHSSKWTDQEMGWALGRGVLVVPLRLGVDPYGLVGKIQGVPGKFEEPKKLAARIAKALLDNRQTHGEMRRAAINAFADASSGEMATALCQLLVSIKDITEEEWATLWRACVDNPHVTGADGVRDSIYSTFGAPPAPNPSEVTDDIPF